MTNPLYVLGQALLDTGAALISYLPSLIFAALIIVLGWVSGVMLGRAVTHFVRIIKLDRALHSVGMDELSKGAGVNLSAAIFFGALVKWSIIVAFAVAATDILGLSQFSSMLRDVLSFLPQVAIAVLILIVAVMVADAVSKVITHSLRATQVKADFVGSFAKWAIIIIAGAFPALSQLSIGYGIIQILLIGVVSACSLAFGLAFGLGGKEHASAFIASLKSRNN